MCKIVFTRRELIPHSAVSFAQTLDFYRYWPNKYSFVPPVWNFTVKTRHATSKESNHFHFPCIPTFSKKFHRVFFLWTDILWKKISRKHSLNITVLNTSGLNVVCTSYPHNCHSFLSLPTYISENFVSNRLPRVALEACIWWIWLKTKIKRDCIFVSFASAVYYLQKKCYIKEKEAIVSNLAKS